MNNQYLFTETQKFRQWWLWIIILSIDIMLLIAVYNQVFLEESLGDKPMSNTGLIVTSIVSILVTGLFLFLKLDTRIDTKGIYVRFFPIRVFFKFFAWDTINKAEVRQYKALLEYGGWGIRYGNGKALNVSGNMGLQLIFKNNNKLLIGTNKPDELENIIHKILKSK